MTLDDSAKGLLSNFGGFSIIGGGSYEFTGSPDAATSAIQGLVFLPTQKSVTLGTTETTLFTIVADDGLITPVTDSTTSVATTAVLESYDEWIVRLFGQDAEDPNISPSSTVQKVKGLIYADSGLIFAVSLHYILDDFGAGGQF